MPRKTRGSRSLGAGAERASMRPRPDAAENTSPRPHAGRGQLASMRPRPDAAENEQFADEEFADEVASMRPRPDAAENAAEATDPTRRAMLQ